MIKKSIISIIIIVLIFFFFFKLVTIRGSRSSAYPDKSYCLVNKLAYLLIMPKQSELVVFHDSSIDIDYVARIIGVSGETVTLREGKVFINGSLITEPYLSDESLLKSSWYEAEGTSYTVPKDNYFLLSDDRLRAFHPGKRDFIPKKDFVGKIIRCF